MENNNMKIVNTYLILKMIGWVAKLVGGLVLMGWLIYYYGGVL